MVRRFGRMCQQSSSRSTAMRRLHRDFATFGSASPGTGTGNGDGFNKEHTQLALWAIEARVDLVLPVPDRHRTRGHTRPSKDVMCSERNVLTQHRIDASVHGRFL